MTKFEEEFDNNVEIFDVIGNHNSMCCEVDQVKEVFKDWQPQQALPVVPSDTDKLSVEKLQEELDSCIQTLIEASVAATITQDIVVGNLVDRKLADLAKTQKLAVDYIEKVTGKNIDVVLAENAALDAEEEE